jgi:hypothetical protein
MAGRLAIVCLEMKSAWRVSGLTHTSKTISHLEEKWVNIKKEKGIGKF